MTGALAVTTLVTLVQTELSENRASPVFGVGVGPVCGGRGGSSGRPGSSGQVAIWYGMD